VALMLHAKSILATTADKTRALGASMLAVLPLLI
jgi:hypothetical protein